MKASNEFMPFLILQISNKGFACMIGMRMKCQSQL